MPREKLSKYITGDNESKQDERNNMQYVLRGFSHELGFRIFAFAHVGENRVRTDFTVKTELGLLRKYGIPMQEAALLCRGVLEQRNELDQRRSFTYGEADMRLYAENCEARRMAANERKPPRRSPAQKPGTA